MFDRYTNQETDLPLPITVNVEDVNDNAPTFTGQLQFTVLEQSKTGEKHTAEVRNTRVPLASVIQYIEKVPYVSRISTFTDTFVTHPDIHLKLELVDMN